MLHKYKDMRDALNMVEAYDTLTPQQKDTAKHVARVLYYDSGEKTQKPPFMVLEEKQFNLNIIMFSDYIKVKNSKII